MTDVKENFSKLKERRLNLEVMLGDNRIVRVVGEGTIYFQRESLSPLNVTKVFYVLGLKKNLISVSTIEDRGYEVVFSGGHELMYPKGGSIALAKVIEIRHGKLYRFLFQPVGALVSSASDRTHSSTSHRDLCEYLVHRKWGFPPHDKCQRALLRAYREEAQS